MLRPVSLILETCCRQVKFSEDTNYQFGKIRAIRVNYGLRRRLASFYNEYICWETNGHGPPGSFLRRRNGSIQCGRFPKQVVQIERTREHLDFALLVSRPLVSRAIPVKLDAVTVGVAQVQRLADAVIRSSFQWNAGVQQAAQSISQ